MEKQFSASRRHIISTDGADFDIRINSFRRKLVCHMHIAR
jgi:hypothetical protein